MTTGTGKWAWRRSYASQDSAVPLGAARPGDHLAANPDDIGADRTPGLVRMPMMPSGLVDPNAAGIGYDGRVGGLVDGAPVDHNAEIPHQVDTGTIAAKIQRPSRSIAGVTFATTRREIEPDLEAGSRMAVLRGTNGLPENNPDGFPLGNTVRRWVDRTVRPPRVVQADRPVPHHVAAGPIMSDSPGGVRTSALPWGVSARRRLTQVPMTRQSPPPPLTQVATPDMPSYASDFARGF